MSEIAVHPLGDVPIYSFRGSNVMLDNDLAAFYGVPTRMLHGAVRRIVDRFPHDFMFQLAPDEVDRLRRESGPEARWVRRLHRRPYAFTEQGIHAVSYFLHSPRAIKMSVELIKAFHSLRSIADEQRGLYDVVREVRRRQDLESKRLWDVLRSIRELEDFKAEVAARFRDIANGRDRRNADDRPYLDAFREELAQIERRAMRHRDIFYFVLLIFGALLTALIFLAR